MADPAESSGRSFFLTRLLREVVFAEADLGRRSAVIERRRARAAWITCAAIGLFAAALAATWTVSFVRNEALVRQVGEAAGALERQVAALPPLSGADPLAVLPALDAARALAARCREQDTVVPMSRGLGLSQAGALGTPAGVAYRKLLRDAFLPRIALRVEQQMRDAGSPESRYEALRIYEMLIDPAHRQPADVERWAAADWDRTLPREASPLRRSALLAHLHAALEWTVDMPLPPDRALVDSVRKQLAGSSLAQRAYARLKREGGARRHARVPHQRCRRPAAALVFTRASGAPLSQGIPALFTVAATTRPFVPRPRGSWHDSPTKRPGVLGLRVDRPERRGASRRRSPS